MSIPNVSVYHITHIENLSGIVEDGVLRCDAEQRRRGVKHQNVGYTHIKERRLKHLVKVANGGTLGEYVPFYFCSRSVMLYVLSKGHETYKGGQESIIHLVSSVATIAKDNKPCFFTDRHADLEYARQFDDLRLLEKNVDFSIMKKGFWADCQDSKEKRQAEFLVHDVCPWWVIEEIGVYNIDMKSKVEEALQKASHKPRVYVRKKWYY